MVTCRDIVNGLRRLGLGPGSVVVVHSALSSFGQVEGGAITVIAALQETVTPRGLILMPVHTYSLKGRIGSQPFDPRTTPSETGLIPTVFWQLPDVQRSRHPTHSAAAWGDRAAAAVADHENRGAVGRDSPLHRAALWGGSVLQLGVRHNTNTTLHLAEVLADLPYLHIPFRRVWGTTVIIRQPDGSVRDAEVPNEERPGCSAGFVAIEPLLAARGLTRETMIGACCARLTPMKEMLEVAVAALRQNPALFLCQRPECERCAEARLAVAAARLQQTK